MSEPSPFLMLAVMFAEDFAKFGSVDEHGQLWMDDGVQRVLCGRLK